MHQLVVHMVIVSRSGQRARVNQEPPIHQLVVHMVIISKVLPEGQSEPVVTNAPVGCSVNWMGSVFLFSIRWGLS
jgi:hypothetical protein